MAVLKTGKEMRRISEIDMKSLVGSTPVPANGVLYVMTRVELYALVGGADGSVKDRITNLFSLAK